MITVVPIPGFEDLQARKPRRRPRHLEDAEQRALMDWLQYQHPSIFLFTYHPPNGGFRSKIEAAIMAGLGVKAGMLDILCFVPMGGFNGLAVELKQPKATPSDITGDQRTWINRLRVAGWRAEAAPGFEHAKQIFEQYLAGRAPAGWQPWGE